MQSFEYIVPKDLAEASALLAAGNGTIRPFQGGTDLLIRIRGGVIKPERVLDLKALPGLREIRQSENGWLAIGAACTMNQVALHPRVQARYDLLAQACNSVASYQLRNRATVGGNCCNASPAADSAPALYCLDAVAEIYGEPAGTRRIPIAEFFVGPGRTALGKGEFLTAIHLPPAPEGARGAFSKLGRTKLGDIATVSVAVYAWPEERRGDPSVVAPSAVAPSVVAPSVVAPSVVAPQSGRRDSALTMTWRIALGAVGPTPLRAPEAEAALAADTSSEGIKRAAELAAAVSRPIDDIRASAAYRRAMVGVLTRRGIEAVLADLTGFGNPSTGSGQALSGLPKGGAA